MGRTKRLACPACRLGRRAGADIDHVVIASFGVVTVNTKTTKTRVWVGEYGMTVGRNPATWQGRRNQPS